MAEYDAWTFPATSHIGISVWTECHFPWQVSACQFECQLWVLHVVQNDCKFPFLLLFKIVFKEMCGKLVFDFFLLDWRSVPVFYKMGDFCFIVFEERQGIWLFPFHAFNMAYEYRNVEIYLHIFLSLSGSASTISSASFSCPLIWFFAGSRFNSFNSFMAFSFIINFLIFV